MKIMMIVAEGKPGGGTTSVLALAEDLISRGIDVAICSQRDSYALDEAKQLGAEVCGGLDFFRRRLNRHLVGGLRAVVDSVDPDIVHVHGGRAAFNWVRCGDSDRLPRTIYTVHGYQFWCKPQPHRFFAKCAERRISRNVFRTVYVSNSDQAVGIDQSLVSDRSCTVVIRNGILLSEIPPRENVQADETELRKQVAVLGRITEAKNPNLILDIAVALAKDGFVIHFIGGGELEDSIRRRVEQEKIHNVVMHGNQSRGDGLKLMSKMGTFLLASLWEGLPIAPVEAMAMGLAVVISDVNGCTEAVRHDIEGRVAPSQNLAAFVAALRSVVAEPAETQRMIENGKRRVAEEFTIDRVIRQHLELYRDCLASNPR